MSPEAAVRCRQWLEEQLELLRGLRNGNPRDAQFKLWRQTTLTVLQRIWPGDSSRTDRFRRIRFTPPQNRPDAKRLGEWFTRGCDEAVSQLAVLIAEIDRDGVPVAAAPDFTEVDDTTGLAEEAYPTLDLNTGGSPAGARSVEIPAEREIILDLGGSSAPSAPEGVTRDATGPAPPKLPAKASSRSMARPAPADASPSRLIAAPARAASAKTITTAPAAAATPPAPARPPAPAAPPPAAPAPIAPSPAPPPQTPASRAAETVARARAAKKNAPKPRLKDLLGLDDVVARVSHEPAPVAAAPSAEPSPVASAAPVDAAREVPPVPSVEAEPQPVAMAPAPAEAPAFARAEVAPPPPVEEVPAVAEAQPAVAEAAPYEPVEVEPPVAALLAAEPPVAEPVAFAESPEPGSEAAMEGEIVEEVTQRFLDSSPVLSLTGRPVQRRTDVTRFEHPDAVAMATFAEDAGRLGVPEARREKVRAQLLELAQSLESGDPDWDLMADVVRESVRYRALTQRLLPVLLPWMTRAA